MKRALLEQDVERILRDVLHSQGLRVSTVRAERTPDGWLVTVTDVTGRIPSTHVADGLPAVIRAALTRWLLNHN